MKNQDLKKGANPTKVRIVEELNNLIKNKKTILVASIKNIPASQFQEIVKKLRGKAIVKVPKKNLIFMALDNSGKEVVKITRVPRTWVEGEDTENRGVGESINLPFEMMIHNIHRTIIEPQINNHLLDDVKKRKKGKSPLRQIQIRFNEISRKGEMEILQNAGLIMNFGAKPEALVSFLDERGILGFDPTDFDVDRLTKDPESNESRKRMNKSTDNMTQNRNEAGVSDESGKKMKAEA